MDFNKTKIRLLTSVNYPKIFSLYKVSSNDLLVLNDNGLSFKYHSEIPKEHILSISKYIPGGLNFESWIKIEFMKGGSKKEIYITSRRFFGFGPVSGDNEQIAEELIRKYLSKNKAVTQSIKQP
jgi:hypothetical protein